MDEATIRRLNAINRAFYARTAADFSETRARPWPGWERLLAYFNGGSVLDVGCGNGRFGRFLAERREVVYHGVDNNPVLLDHARAALPAATLDMRDVVESPPAEGAFDLVVAFGLLHHIPGTDRRREFVRALAERVAPGGALAVTGWRFYEFERFRERIVPWPEDIAVERHDYLLDWRRGTEALRYCHYIDDDEHDALVAASGLRELIRYRADGFTGTVNAYSILSG